MRFLAPRCLGLAGIAMAALVGSATIPERAHATVVANLAPQFGCIIDNDPVGSTGINTEPPMEICLEPFSARAGFNFTVNSLRDVTLNLAITNTSDPATQATLTAIGFNMPNMASEEIKESDGLLEFVPLPGANATVKSFSGDLNTVVFPGKFNVEHEVLFDPFAPDPLATLRLGRTFNEIDRVICIREGNLSTECTDIFVQGSPPGTVPGVVVGETENLILQFMLASDLDSTDLASFESLFTRQAAVVGHFHLPGPTTYFGAGNLSLCSQFENGNLALHTDDACGLVSAQPISEPTTLALFGVGLAGLGLMRRRRRSA